MAAFRNEKAKNKTKKTKREKINRIDKGHDFDFTGCGLLLFKMQ